MIYWFSYAYTNNMAKNEAIYCADIIKPWKDKIKYVYFDFEYDSMNYAKRNGINPSKSLVTSMTKNFCKKIEELLETLKETGTTESMWDQMMDHKEVFKLFDIHIRL